MLANCQTNVEQHLQQHFKPLGGSAVPASASRRRIDPPTVPVRQLDWLEPPDWLLERPEPADKGSSRGSSGFDTQPPKQQGQPQQGGPAEDRFAWRPEDVAALQQLDYLLAADSVYDDVLTEAFMRRWANGLCS